MIKRVIRIVVEDGEVEELNKELTKTKANIDNVEGSSKKADTALKKVGENGGAIATLDALTGGLASRIRDAAEATKVFNFSLKGTKAALIATGVGAVAVGIGLIVQYWDRIVDYITGASEKLQEHIDLLERRNDIIKSELDILDAQEKLLIAQGKSTDDLLKTRRQLLQAQIGINGAELVSLELQKQKLENQAKELTFLERLAAGGGRVRGKLTSPVTDEEQSEIDQVTLKINSLRQSIALAQAAIQELDNPTTSKGSKETDPTPRLDKVDSTTGDDLDKEKESLSKRLEELFGIQDAFRNAELEKANAFAESDIAITARREKAKRDYEAASAKERERIAEAEAEAKMMLYEQTANAFAAASNLVGQETAAGKAFAVAASLISTYAAISKTLAAFAGVPIPGYAIAQSAAIGLSGFAAVKGIISTKVPGGFSSGSLPGTGLSSTPPAFNVVGTSPQNQLNQALLEQNREPVEAFVVEGTVTSAEQLRRNKIQASSLG
jgi:hypothetical protein